MAIKRYNTNQTLIDSGFRQLSGGTLTLSGNTVIASAGTLSYATCMHEFYTARSVVDADFVTGRTSCIIDVGEPQQVIFRDVSGITGATGFTYDKATSGVTVPNLSISIAPPDDVLGEYILTWDDTFKQVRKIPATTSVGLQTAENGLTAVGSVVRLGGALNQCTVIDGANEHQMIFRNLGGACVATTEGNIVLDSRLDTGGVYIKSQSGTGNTAASFAGAVGIEIEYEPNRFVIHDNRSAFNQVGIEYAANYSPRYTNRSLVDKEYVDTIASGLQPKQAVAVATTGETNNIDLSETGLTTYIIDGIEIGEGDRVLIKDQNDATENGIYVITSGGTWQRSDDFDEDSEVVQGAYTFVVSGQTNESTQWVVTTPDPIAVNVTPINWVLFNRISNIVAGSGINVVNDEGVFNINLGGELTQDAVFSGGTLNYADDYSSSFSANTLITKAFAESIAASGGVVIEDEGTTVLTGVTHINFIGIDVKAQNAESGGIKRVNVYIPPPEYVSNFNTTNGTSNATVGNISTTNRYVALPDSEGTPYKVGDWTGGNIVSTIRNSVSTLTYTSNQFSMFDSGTTTFEAVVFDADGVTEIASHEITLTGNSSQTSDNITINVTSFEADFDKFKANIQIQIAISTILSQGGRFSVRLTHDNAADGTFTKTQNNIFRDTETLTAGFGGGAAITVVPQTPVTKFISGIEFFTTNTDWKLDVDELNNLNSRSYPTAEQVRISSSNFFITETIDINGETGVEPYSFSAGTWTRQHDTTNAVFSKNNWRTNQTNQTNWVHGGCTINANTATAQIFDWVAGPTLNSTNYNYLIDTYIDSSSRNSEMFRREDHATFPRLRSNLITSWDNTASLATEDGGNGLQILADRLVYPQCNFTGFLPSPQRNYTSLTGNKTYYRKFETNGNTVSNGIIQLVTHNITETDLSTDNVIFELSIDSGSTWFILNDEYPGGIIGDGDGCRINPLTNALNINGRLEFTFGAGKFSSYIHLKITYTTGATSRYITGINLLGTNWA